ncbi:MAG: glycosyltransferase [Phycisphaerae bacterium]|nr:glycosyltransferase [Phycisphaerae bacterium]
MIEKNRRIRSCEDSVIAGSADTGLRVMHVISSIAAKMGGPSWVVTGLCESLGRAGCYVDLCTVDHSRNLGAAIPVNEMSVHLHSVPCNTGRLHRMFSPRGFRQMLLDAGSEADIIHSHGLWEPVSNTVATVAAELGRPHVISIHGMFSPYAMQRSAWKKRIASLFYVRRNIRLAGCLNVLTHQEMQDTRNFGARSPIALIPNGTTLPDLESLPSRIAAKKRLADLPDKKLLLFLGRIHPIKNLPGLIEAWRELADKFTDWHLVIAGPDEVGQLAELRDQVRRGRLDKRVTFMGPAFGEDKEMLLRAADVFCLTSHTEGFSMAILEALAWSLPVLITHGCNFDEVEDAGVGVVVRLGPEAIADGLRRMLSLDESQLQGMGAGGRRLMKERYSWDKIADKMISVYNWLLGRGEKPACVTFEQVARDLPT